VIKTLLPFEQRLQLSKHIPEPDAVLHALEPDRGPHDALAGPWQRPALPLPQRREVPRVEIAPGVVAVRQQRLAVAALDDAARAGVVCLATIAGGGVDERFFVNCVADMSVRERGDELSFWRGSRGLDLRWMARKERSFEVVDGSLECSR
jgi:hypothetical protein